MSELSEHFKKLLWLSKLQEEEVATMREHGHFDNDAELEIKYKALAYTYNEAIKHYHRKKDEIPTQNNDSR